MKLSVIIPCLNGEATLPIQLEALANQTWAEPWEVIIADNGSTDNSVKIAQRYRGRLPTLRVVSAVNRKGPAYARNVGVEEACADALAFCDADDEVAAGWVKAMGESLAKYDIVYGQFCFDKFNDPQKAEASTQHWKNGLYRGRFLPGGGTGNLGVKKAVHDAIGGFDEDILHSEDADYYWRLQLEGFELRYVPDAIVQVRHARVNPTLRYLYRRARARAASNCWLYKRYRSWGMSPPTSFSHSLVVWLRIVRRLPRSLLKSERRGEWFQKLAQGTGDLVGQVEGRITNPCKPFRPGRNLDKQTL
jgi:glycosyltransferase involved in cell wall biosynthesis